MTLLVVGEHFQDVMIVLSVNEIILKLHQEQQTLVNQIFQEIYGNNAALIQNVRLDLSARSIKMNKNLQTRTLT